MVTASDLWCLAGQLAGWGAAAGVLYYATVWVPKDSSKRKKIGKEGKL